MNRVCAFALLVALLLFQAQPLRKVVTAQTRPNIVAIMADDLDVQTFAAAASGGLLPNITSNLINVGQSFTEAFVTTSEGAPTRATFLTGQYPHNDRVMGSFPPLGGISEFNANSTVGTWLRTAGYITGYVGRYIFGYGQLTDPTSIPPGWDFWAATTDPSTYSTSDYQFNVQGTLFPASAFAGALGRSVHQTDASTILAGAYLSQVTGSQPFFLSLNPYVPNYEVPTVNECPTDPGSYWGGNIWGVTARPTARHADTVFGDALRFGVPQPPSFNESDISDKPSWMRDKPSLSSADIDCLQRAYWRRLECLRDLDDLVGYVIGRLQATGKLSNTIIILTSDNGFMNGQHRLTQKGAPYEDAVHVPLIIRMPSNLSPRAFPHLVANVDLAPTIAQFAGATPTLAVDGRSLVPLLSNPNAAWRRMLLIEHYDAITIEGFSYPPPYGALRVSSPVPKLFVRYAGTPSEAEEYDLSTDPYELENRSGDPARQTEIAAFDQWLAAMLGCKAQTCQVLEQIFALP